MLCDLHCHIDLFERPEAVASEAEKARIFTIAVSNTPDMYHDARKHLSGFRYIKPALGLHPGVRVNRTVEMKKFMVALPTAQFVGEIGLDGLVPSELKNEQEESFERILALLGNHQCLISLHTRRKERAVLDYLKKYKLKNCIFHWYTGPAQLIDQIVSEDHYFSVNLAMFKHPSSLEKIARMPKNRVLTESDGPFATNNKQKLSPLSIKETVVQLASLWKVSAEEAEKTIEQNLIQLASLNRVSLGFGN